MVGPGPRCRLCSLRGWRVPHRICSARPVSALHAVPLRNLVPNRRPPCIPRSRPILGPRCRHAGGSRLCVRGGSAGVSESRRHLGNPAPAPHAWHRVRRLQRISRSRRIGSSTGRCHRTSPLCRACLARRRSRRSVGDRRHRTAAPVDVGQMSRGRPCDTSSAGSCTRACRCLRRRRRTPRATAGFQTQRTTPRQTPTRQPWRTHARTGARRRGRGPQAAQTPGASQRRGPCGPPTGPPAWLAPSAWSPGGRRRRSRTAVAWRLPQL